MLVSPRYFDSMHNIFNYKAGNQKKRIMLNYLKFFSRMQFLTWIYLIMIMCKKNLKTMLK